MITVDSLSAAQLASYIDHTFLQADGDSEPINRLCEEAEHYGFAMVAVNPSEVSTCRKLLEGSAVRVGAAVGFPLGQNTTATKIFEINDSISNGAVEIDMVVNQRALRKGDTDTARAEINQLGEICRANGVISKLILECCNLTHSEKVAACKLALDAGIDFVKTSTGFGSHGAAVDDVKLMKDTVGDSIQVKAAGGIRSLDSALSMLNAGATRLGTSSGVLIMNEFLNEDPVESFKKELY